MHRQVGRQLFSPLKLFVLVAPPRSSQPETGTPLFNKRLWEESVFKLGGRDSTEVLPSSQPAIPGSILVVPESFQLKIYNWKIFGVAEIYRQWHCLESGQCKKSLIVDRTHLVLVSGKLVLQKESVLTLTTESPKYCPGSKLLNISVHMGTVVSNRAG